MIDDDQGIGAVQIDQAGLLEILGAEIHYGKVQIRFEELQNAVGFDDDVVAGLENLSKLRQRVGQLTCRRPYPIGPPRSRRKITAAIRPAPAIRFP